MKLLPFSGLLAAIALQLSVIGSARADLFEADYGSGNIYILNASGGKTLYTAGVTGVEGLAFDSHGNLFASATGTGIIYKYATDGTQTTFASGLNGPASLVFDAAGNLFDAEFFGGVIYRFAPDGTRTTFATGLSGPANLAFNSAGDLFEANFNTGTIYRFTPAGVRTTFATGVGRPHGLVFAGNGDLFVADFQGGVIYRFTPGGTRTVFATGLNGPHGITLDSGGNLFTADYNTGAVYRFTPEGTRTTFATGLNNPANLLFPPSLPSADNLLNVSTRTFVGTQTGVLIGGFILQGANPTTLVFRAIGPSLVASGVSDALENPFLELYDNSGTLIASNDDWSTGADAAAIERVGLAPSDTHESALRATLPSGAYTIVIRGVGDDTVVGGFQPGITGIGLVEIYDLQQSQSRAVNLSTRGNVRSGDGVMIAGCIIGGAQSKELIVRAIGPSLASRGVPDALEDPRLQFLDANGTPVATNLNWQSGPDAASIQSRGFAPESSLEAALQITVPPGAYTAVESPEAQGSGIGLIEIFDLSPAPTSAE